MLLHDQLQGFFVILASKSPRRQSLLKSLGIDFTIIPKEVNENYSSELKREKITEFLAKKKSEAFGKLNTKEILITSDTIVWFQGKALEKPRNKKQAKEMLQELSGKNHEVITSVYLRNSHAEHVFSEETQVFFRPLIDAEIEYYINAFEPFDKAGSYGIQEWIGFVGVEKIHGCFYNVMGLPLSRLYSELQKFLS